MTTASASPPQQKDKNNGHFDPDDYRMTIGEHLEELRWRLILGLIGLFVAVVVCMTFGERMIEIFCAPLVSGLKRHHLSTQIITNGLTEGFMTYLQISMISAAVLAGPWLIYQLWLFVAAGLYPDERKTVTKYVPLSVSLLVAGVLFVYFIVLPLTVDFFLAFTSGLPLPVLPKGPGVDASPPAIPVLEGDPKKLVEGMIYFDKLQGRLKIVVRDDGSKTNEIRVIQFGSENLVTPMLTLGDYINLVMMFMLVFGLSFQLPLVLLALVSVGIVEITFLRKQRRLVYFVMAIVAAVIAPGDIVTTMLLLLIPMLILYEFGIWLAMWSEKKRQRREREEPA